MMSDKIEPALSDEEWEDIRDNPYLVGWTVDESGLGTRGTIAMLNAALPDDDPRKITREKIARLRSLLQVSDDYAGDNFDESGAFLDAIESYLPPETG